MFKTLLFFEYNGLKRSKLIYLPKLKENFDQNNIEFKDDLIELLIDTEFNKKCDLNEKELRKKIKDLLFDKKIIFDYTYGKIFTSKIENS
jgi:hypothetical protein